MDRIPPQWVTDLVREYGGGFRQPRFIMIKSLTSSDMDIKRQNRLLIRTQYVDANLIPMLSEAEKAAANLLDMPTARRNTPSTSRVQGRKHGGLEVCVYTRSGFRCHLMLTRWDAAEYPVIKGKEYKMLLNRSFLQEHDEVEMWCFRQGESGRLCFTLGKREQ